MNAALTKTLLQFIWEGGLIALALALVLKVFRPARARFRYGAACITMLAMLAAFGITLVWSLPHAPKTAPPAIELGWSQPAGELEAPLPLSPHPFWWLAPAWMLGASLFSLRSLASWFSAQRLQRVGVCLAPEHWQERMLLLAERIRVSRPVVLLESCLTEVPVVLGCLRPVILLPAGLLTGFPAQQVEYFLIHELTHVRRWDYLVNLLQTAAENLLFYHPAVWWVSAVVRAERENCCDDVVAAHGDAREFALALASLEQGRGAALEPAVAANGGNLMKRVRRLIGQPEPRRTALTPVLLFGLALAIAAAIAGPQKSKQPPAPSISTPAAPLLAAPVPADPVRVAQAQTNPQPPASSDAPALEDPYRRWLNEEAVYVITDAERQAFRGLQTDQEREMFIEQFWLRRDPTPGTLENEYREEHYRRIAYANDRFGTDTVAGWKTDRGMIYIKFGPPDEKELHPDAAPPRDVWLYRFIQGIGQNVKIEFVDESRTGEYRMTRDPAAAPAATVPSPPAQTLPGGGGRGGRDVALAQFLDGDATISVRPRSGGRVTAVHVTERQFVRAGQPLADLDSNNPPYDHILAPADGFVSIGSLKAGQQVAAGQQLLTIAARTRTPEPQRAEPPLSYFEAEVKSLEYQAGFESAYLNLQTNPDRDGAALKRLEEAVLELNRSMRGAAADLVQARAALDRLRKAVASARAARSGSPAQPEPQTPWWAADPQDPAAAKAIEISARIQLDGTAREVSVVRSGDPSLNQSAIDAVQSWRFPLMSGGRVTYAIDVLVDPTKLARR